MPLTQVKQDTAAMKVKPIAAAAHHAPDMAVEGLLLKAVRPKQSVQAAETPVTLVSDPAVAAA